MPQIYYNRTSKMLARKLKITLLTDSNTIFNVHIRNASRTENINDRYQATREVYNDGIIDDIIWIRREYNLSDE